jgi:hypothetical protein
MALLYIMLSTTIPVDSVIFNLKNNTISCFPGGKYFLEPFRCGVYDALLYHSVLRKSNISTSAIKTLPLPAFLLKQINQNVHKTHI